MDGITSKYAVFEEELSAQMVKLKLEEKRVFDKYPPGLDSANGGAVDVDLDLQAAVKRNKQLKQDLEKTKARFRSKTTYSPLENVLGQAKANFLREFTAVERQQPSRIQQPRSLPSTIM